MKKLVSGMFFGQIEFLTGEPRLAGARSTDITTLISINRDKFIELLKNSPR